MCVDGRVTNRQNIRNSQYFLQLVLFSILSSYKNSPFSNKKLTLEGAFLKHIKVTKTLFNFTAIWIRWASFRSAFSLSAIILKVMNGRENIKSSPEARIWIVCEKFIAYCWTSEFIFCLSLHHTLLTSGGKIAIKQTSFEGCHNPNPFSLDSPNE